MSINPFDLDAWNAALERVRDEYATHPFASAACPDCGRWTRGDGDYCRPCKEERNELGN